MALRFHRHELSENYAKDSCPISRREMNQANTTLAKHVNNFFWESDECQDGYWAGGKNKLLYITNGDATWLLPVALKPGPDGNPTPLATLIEDLYALLREHYRAINYKDLEHLKVAKKVQMEAELDTTEEDPAQAIPPSDSIAPQVPIRDSYRRVNGLLTRARAKRAALSSETLVDAPPPSADPLPQHRTSPAPSTSMPIGAPTRAVSTTEATSTPPGGKSARRVLDNHEAVIRAFEKVFSVDDAKTQPRDLSLYDNDKGFDQFDGLGTSKVIATKGPSGTSGKRKQSEAENAYEDGSESKQVRGSIWCGPDLCMIREVPEEIELVPRRKRRKS